MRRSAALILAVCLMLSAVILCSCGEEEKADGALTPVKDESGNITGYERKYHNDHGDITRWDIYDENEEYQSFVIYEYDSEYRLTKELTYRADGIGESGITYDYYDDGTLREEYSFSAKGDSSRCIYDTEGSWVEAYYYDDKDELIKHQVNENGEWIDAPLEESTEESSDTTE